MQQDLLFREKYSGAAAHSVRSSLRVAVGRADDDQNHSLHLPTKFVASAPQPSFTLPDTVVIGIASDVRYDRRQRPVWFSELILVPVLSLSRASLFGSPDSTCPGSWPRRPSAPTMAIALSATVIVVKART